MAEDKKDSKPKSSGGIGDVTFFLGMMVILFIFWVLTGGPERSPDAKTNQFITPGFKTYHEPLFGQPGSITNTIPIFK